MLSRGFRILWIRIKVDTPKHINIHFPVPLYIFQELLDCFLDLLVVVSLFTSKTPGSFQSPSFSIHAVREVVQMIMKLFDSLTEHEAYELVDVTTGNVEVSIKIR